MINLRQGLSYLSMNDMCVEVCRSQTYSTFDWPYARHFSVSASVQRITLHEIVHLDNDIGTPRQGSETAEVCPIVGYWKIAEMFRLHQLIRYVTHADT